MKQIPNKEAITVASAVEQCWLGRYPWRKKITFDKGSEFMSDLQDDSQNYGIKRPK